MGLPQYYLVLIWRTKVKDFTNLHISPLTPLTFYTNRNAISYKNISKTHMYTYTHTHHKHHDNSLGSNKNKKYVWLFRRYIMFNSVSRTKYVVPGILLQKPGQSGTFSRVAIEPRESFGKFRGDFSCQTFFA